VSHNTTSSVLVRHFRGRILVRLLPDSRDEVVMKCQSYYVAAVLSFLLCFTDAAFSQSTPPNPKAILKEMVAGYAGFSSYQDTGVVQTLSGDSLLASGSERPRFINVHSGAETVVSFKTYFARPRMFRFEWKGILLPASREAVVWSDGKKDYSWMPSRGSGDDSFMLYNGAKLRFYVDEAQGLSSGAIFFIPSLLIKEFDYMPFGAMINSMTELSLVKDEQVDGEACHVVSGKIYGTPWVLWVGKHSRLLRKTRTLYTSGSFHEMLEKGRVKTYVAEEIHREIRINEKIPRETFKYKPQLRANDVDLTR
jgi:outer membrane lipoprotein-sorting protein